MSEYGAKDKGTARLCALVFLPNFGLDAILVDSESLHNEHLLFLGEEPSVCGIVWHIPKVKDRDDETGNGGNDHKPLPS